MKNERKNERTNETKNTQQTSERKKLYLSENERRQKKKKQQQQQHRQKGKNEDKKGHAINAPSYCASVYASLFSYLRCSLPLSS